MNKKALDLMTLNEDQVKAFIRQRLSFGSSFINQLRIIRIADAINQHRRFDMSGYEDIPGSCTLHNLAIVNEFADLGIYDYTSYLFLDFYKGTPTIYLKYFYEEENFSDTYDGWTTTEIIYEILKLTIFSGKGTRRRD